VQFVDDVSAWEAMKLRLLNAAHSTLAYLGVPAGLETVDRAIAEPSLRAFVQALWSEEVAPTLPENVQPQVPDYCAQLLERFANPALGHRTRQIAMDGSQKLPQRLLDTVRDNLAAGRPIDRAALAVAGWMRYVCGVDEAGREIRVADPLAAELARVAAAHRGDPAALARGLLGLAAVFGTDLPADPRFVEPVTGWLAALFADGAARTVARAAQGLPPAAQRKP
jgi:fructuronate reductase